MQEPNYLLVLLPTMLDWTGKTKRQSQVLNYRKGGGRGLRTRRSCVAVTCAKAGFPRRAIVFPSLSKNTRRIIAMTINHHIKPAIVFFARDLWLQHRLGRSPLRLFRRHVICRRQLFRPCIALPHHVLDRNRSTA
jgi:hypothetical protein